VVKTPSILSVLLCTFIACASASLGAAEPAGAESNIGVPVSYSLPGEPGTTYRVTLAIVDPQNPAWIVSQFAAGVVRTVTAENGGKFSETWNGLDDNFMPVPPGKYGVKGIYMPAATWPVDGAWHSITPKFAGGASAWLPSPDQPSVPVPFGGDPVNAPLQDVAAGPNGVAVFYYQYLENGTNCPQFDLNKPIGYEQFVRAYNSGGAGGGSCAATDGETVWAFSTDGGPKYVYRADQKSFGESPGANRRNGYLPEGWVTAMAVWSDRQNNPSASRRVVYCAQRGRIVQEKQTGSSFSHRYMESKDDFVDQVTVHDGADGKVLATVPLRRPLGLAVYGDMLFALHGPAKEPRDGSPQGAWAVSAVNLVDGIPQGAWQPMFDVPASITPADLEIDGSGRFYLSDSAANHVYQLDARGKVIRTFGKLDEQKPGTYDRETLMNPERLATWTDADGKHRLLVVEAAGPNRVSEWNADDGRLLREFPTYQTKCNNGYAIDPADASLVYLPGQRDWLTRFKIDYATRQWTVDAVWPNVEGRQAKGLDKPQAIRVNDNLYLAGARTLLIYRLAGDRWLRSAGLIKNDADKNAWSFWNDADGDGEIDAQELRPTTLPGQVITYHGQRWLPDLSYVAAAQGGRDVWRLAPDGFDPHGNPVFTKWEKLFTDPIFEARAEGKADALHGGNELAQTFSSDWMQVDGSVSGVRGDGGFYVQARGGKNFTANFGAQHKISRYVPDGKGGYQLRWRVGRSVIDGVQEPDELSGGMRCFKPINGLLTVVDQSRSGLMLFTDEGLYVDTIFPTGGKEKYGVYPQPGEFFAGTVYANQANGKIYYASGKYTPMLFEMHGWSLTENPVRELKGVQAEVEITAAQTASPPEAALALRGGAGTALLARFAPALGGPTLDGGSLEGWEMAEPVRFASGKQTVEARLLYDPEHIYVRWNVLLDSSLALKPLPPPERLFTHDQGAHTVGFYIQGDAQAKSQAGARSAAGRQMATGRPGDVRFTFGLFLDGGKVRVASVGMYPDWSGPGAKPQTYRTPVGTAEFAHVAPIEGLRTSYNIDQDFLGFVITAAIPRSAIPALEKPFDASLRTLVNFDANLGGHHRFWWANRDGSANRETYDEPSEARLYPGSWAPAEFQSLAGGVTVRNWLVCGPLGGPGTEQFKNDPNGPLPGTKIEMKKAVRDFCEKAVYPPDTAGVDLDAVYKGEMIQGYWPDPRAVRWKPATIEGLDTRVKLGGGGQVWYAATWIYAEEAAEVKFQVQGHPQTEMRATVSSKAAADRPILLGPFQEPTVEERPGEGHALLRVAEQKVKLAAGWNEIRLRTYCYGYAPFRVGLVVDAPVDKLWKLKFSGTKP